MDSGTIYLHGFPENSVLYVVANNLSEGYLPWFLLNQRKSVNINNLSLLCKAEEGVIESNQCDHHRL